MSQPKALKAWRIDQARLCLVDMVQTGICSGVATRSQGCRMGLSLGLCVGYQDIQNAGFTHGTLAEQQGCFALQQGNKLLFELLGGKNAGLNDRDANSCQWLQLFPCLLG